MVLKKVSTAAVAAVALTSWLRLSVLLDVFICVHARGIRAIGAILRPNVGGVDGHAAHADLGSLTAQGRIVR
jgi:hypothetical protein